MGEMERVQHMAGREPDVSPDSCSGTWDGDAWQIPEEQLCRKCRRRRIDRSENRNSILCRECREEQIRYPFPKKAIPVVVLVLLAVGAAMVRTPRVLHHYKLYTEAAEQAGEGYIAPALTALNEVLEHYPDSVPVAERAIDLAMEHGYYDSAVDVFYTYLEGKSVDGDQYYKFTRYSERLSRFYGTYGQLAEVFGKLGEPPQEAEAQRAWLEDTKKQLLDMALMDTSDRSVIYYYLGIMSEDQQEAQEYLQKSVAEDPAYIYAQVALGTSYRRGGDLEKAKGCYETSLALDRQSAGALRAMGILRMLEGDLAGGLADVQSAWEADKEESYVKETLLIALLENGKKEKADQYRQQFESEGAVFDEDFEAYYSGNMTLHDYYIDAE